MPWSAESGGISASGETQEISAEIPGSPAPPRIGPEEVCGSSVVSPVIKSLPFPIRKVASVDLKVTDAALRADRHTCSFPDLLAASASLSSCIVERKSVEMAFKSGDIGGIDPFIFGPELLYRHPQFYGAVRRPIYHGIELHSEC